MSHSPTHIRTVVLRPFRLRPPAPGPSHTEGVAVRARGTTRHEIGYSPLSVRVRLSDIARAVYRPFGRYWFAICRPHWLRVSTRFIRFMWLPLGGPNPPFRDSCLAASWWAQPPLSGCVRATPGLHHTTCGRVVARRYTIPHAAVSWPNVAR